MIGGDAPVPAGEFPDSASLLRALDHLGRPLRDIGMGGYPEGHAHISAAAVPDSPSNIRGIRIFTFNEIAGTEMWRRSIVESLPPGSGRR